MDKNENIAYQNLYKHQCLVEIYNCEYLYLKRSQISNLTLHLKILEKEEQTKPNTNRRKEIIKINAKIN